MKIKLNYKVVNNLDDFVVRKVGVFMAEGRQATKKEVLEDIAKHCEVGFENIKRISRNASQPSLAVAFKISEYFGVRVDEIFELYKE